MPVVTVMVEPLPVEAISVIRDWEVLRAALTTSVVIGSVVSADGISFGFERRSHK